MPATATNERSFQKSEVVMPGRTRRAPARRAAAEPKHAATRPRATPTPAVDAADEHRQRILDAAEALFSTQGFHGTGLRGIADRAGVSLGNIYNHFETKTALFEALMETLEARYFDPNEPLPRALLEVDFPENLELLGTASRETVKRFATYIRLIYVDVIEFNGKHVARMYGGMKDRYEKVFAERFREKKRAGVFGDVSPVIGAMMTTSLFMFYFTVEHLFGVHKHYGLSDEQVIGEFARIFRLGMLKR
jgi:AcrR family transcriptional regulator